jgi:alanine racemase
MASPILTVSLTAIVQNFRRAQRCVGPKVEVGAVVKANAYGLGVRQCLNPTQRSSQWAALR